MSALYDDIAIARARRVHSAMFDAWLASTGLMAEPAPSLAKYTLSEMLASGQIMRAQPHEPLPNGGLRIRSVLAPRLIRQLHEQARKETQ